MARRFPFLERIFADAGYQGPRVAAAAPRPVEIIKRTDAGFVVQPKRWVIERTFAWACINRRLARDVERAAETVKALSQIALIKLLMVRRIARFRDFRVRLLTVFLIDLFRFAVNREVGMMRYIYADQLSERAVLKGSMFQDRAKQLGTEMNGKSLLTPAAAQSGFFPRSVAQWQLSTRTHY